MKESINLLIHPNPGIAFTITHLEMLSRTLIFVPAMFLFSGTLCSCRGQEAQNAAVSGSTESATDTLLNQKDAQGLKQGLWVERKRGVKETYYVNGVKQGLFRSYAATTGKLEAFEWYEDGKPSGTWYYFDQYGRLYLSEAVMPENKTIKIKNAAGEFLVLPFISQVKLYHANGVVSGEGVAIYDESVQFDFYKFGVWKYYDEAGKLLRTENYPEGKIVE